MCRKSELSYELVRLNRWQLHREDVISVRARSLRGENAIRARDTLAPPTRSGPRRPPVTERRIQIALETEFNAFVML